MSKVPKKPVEGEVEQSTSQTPPDPLKDPTSPYWKGRQYPGPPGSRRARIEPGKTVAIRSATSGRSNQPTFEERKNEGYEIAEALAEFQEFKETLLPSLQGDVQSGMSAEEILRKYQAVAAAKMVSLLMDNKVGYAAAKELLDRTMGKAVERKAIKHQFEDLSEKEIDALIITAMKDSEDDTDES